MSMNNINNNNNNNKSVGKPIRNHFFFFCLSMFVDMSVELGGILVIEGVMLTLLAAHFSVALWLKG